MITITTPTGNIGSQVVERLIEGDEELQLLARRPERLPAGLRDRAIVCQGSTDDVGFMRSATRGARALFLCVPPVYQAESLRDTMLGFADAALEAIAYNKISHVVFVSSGGKGVKNAGPISILHEIEDLLMETGANVAFLRAGFFMENFLNFTESIKRSGMVCAPVSGGLRLPMVACKDIADKAADLLSTSSWQGQQAVPIHGPADLALDQAVAILGDAIGKEVRFVTVPEATAEHFLLQTGASKDVVRETLDLYRAFAAGSIYHAEPRTSTSTTATTLVQWASEEFRQVASS